MAVNRCSQDYVIICIYWVGVSCVAAVITDPLTYLTMIVAGAHPTFSGLFLHTKKQMRNCTQLLCHLAQTWLLAVLHFASFLCAVWGGNGFCRKRGGVGGGGHQSIALLLNKWPRTVSRPQTSLAVCGPVQSNLAGGVSKEHNVVKQKSDLLPSPLALAPSLSPLEITLNDICYHQDNLCQLRDKTADARPAHFETDEGKRIEMETIRQA